MWQSLFLPGMSMRALSPSADGTEACLATSLANVLFMHACIVPDRHLGACTVHNILQQQKTTPCIYNGMRHWLELHLSCSILQSAAG